MKTLPEMIDELKAIAVERDSLDRKQAEISTLAAKEHCKYKVGSVHINNLEWCFTHMGKKFKVTKAIIQESRSSGYQWRICGSILKSDGSVGQYRIAGVAPLDLPTS
jgi:hypothetical protein